MEIKKGTLCLYFVERKKLIPVLVLGTEDTNEVRAHKGMGTEFIADIKKLIPVIQLGPSIKKLEDASNPVNKALLHKSFEILELKRRIRKLERKEK